MNFNFMAARDMLGMPSNILRGSRTSPAESLSLTRAHDEDCNVRVDVGKRFLSPAWATGG
jgi:hypothetical protein